MDGSRGETREECPVAFGRSTTPICNDERSKVVDGGVSEGWFVCSEAFLGQLSHQLRCGFHPLSDAFSAHFPDALRDLVPADDPVILTDVR